MSYTIQTLTPTLLENHLDSLRDTLAALSTVDRSMTMSEAKKLIEQINAQGEIYVALDTENGDIIGTITLMIQPTLRRGGKSAGHIENLAVHPVHGGKGIGSALIKHALAVSKKSDCYKVILDCQSDLISFYNKFGFEEKEVCMKMYL